jgi:hypothetical protein
MLEGVRILFDEMTAAEDIDAFNTQLAKLFQRLKKDAGASSIKQNYKGTGEQKFRRQLWCNFKSGAVMDIWFDKNGMRFGGVVRTGGADWIGAKGVQYADKTPEQVYAEAMPIVRDWANPKKEDLDEVVGDDKLRSKLILSIYKRINVSDKMLRVKKHSVQLVGSNASGFGVGNYTLLSLEDQTTDDLRRLAKVVGAPTQEGMDEAVNGSKPAELVGKPLSVKLWGLNGKTLGDQFSGFIEDMIGFKRLKWVKRLSGSGRSEGEFHFTPKSKNDVNVLFVWLRGAANDGNLDRYRVNVIGE